MTLAEAIEEVKDNDGGLGYRERDIEEGFDFSLRARIAIATILNAVVKGGVEMTRQRNHHAA